MDINLRKDLISLWIICSFSKKFIHFMSLSFLYFFLLSSLFFSFLFSFPLCTIFLLFLSSFSPFNLLLFCTFLSSPYLLRSFPLLSVAIRSIFPFFLNHIIVFLFFFLLGLCLFKIFFFIFLLIFSFLVWNLSFNCNSPLNFHEHLLSQKFSYFFLNFELIYLETLKC